MMMKLILALLMTSTLTFMNTDKKSPDKTTPTELQQSSENALIHTVYFWLADGLSDTQKADFRGELERLRDQIDEVQMGWIGTPGPTEDRDVIDNSYDFGMTFIFESVEDEAAYQIHPVHTAFVENNSELWTRVQVYDTLVPGE